MPLDFSVEMKTKMRRLYSQSHFNTRGLNVVPSLMGKAHAFSIEKSAITVSLPNMSDATESRNAPAEVDERITATNEPVSYSIYEIVVEISNNVELALPHEVLSRHPNAYDLFTEDEQAQLDRVVKGHESIAKNAFQYWLRIARWTSDNFRIAQDLIERYKCECTTRLKDEETKRNVWAPPMEYTALRAHTMTCDEWELMQSRLSRNEQPPIYRDLLHAAEESVQARDYRRAIVDLAVACETFLRAAVFAKLPDGLTDRVRTFLDQANIAQYYNHFFAEVRTDLIQQIGEIRFKKMKRELAELFEKRNDLVHRGAFDNLDRLTCERFRDTTRELLAAASESRTSSFA